MSSVVISGDTSGAITLAAPAVSGTNTATLPAATGTVMVSGNMPAFSVYIGSSFSTTSNVATKIPLNTENFDTANAFDNTTNYRFTPLVAGYYQINLTVTQGFASASGITYASIYKNGTEYTQGTRVVNSATAGQSGVNSTLLYLNGSTDYIEFYGLQNSGTTQSITFSFAQASGSLVRAA